MKNLFPILFLILISITAFAQQESIKDSLQGIMAQQKGDTTEVNTLFYLSRIQTQIDSAFKYANQGLLLAQNIGYRKGEADCYFQIAYLYTDLLKDNNKGIKNFINALNIYEDIHFITGIAEIQLQLQGLYRSVGDYKKALRHAFVGLKIAEANNVVGRALSLEFHRLSPLYFAEIANTYIELNQLDSAEFYIQKSIEQNELWNGSTWNFPIYLLGNLQNLKGNYKLALTTFRSAIPLAIQNKLFHDTLQIYSSMSSLFLNTNELDSAIYYAKIVNESTNPNRQIHNWLTSIDNLAQAYKQKGNIDSALKYTEYFFSVKDSLFTMDKDRALQSVVFNEKLRQQELISAQAKYKSRLQLYVLIAGLLVLLLIIGILWHNNLEKQKAKSKILE